MMARRRVVIVRGLERWDNANSLTAAVTTASRHQGPPPLDRLAGTRRRPSDTTVVVLVAEARQPSKARLDHREERRVCRRLRRRRWSRPPLAGSPRARRGEGPPIDRIPASSSPRSPAPAEFHLDDVLERLSLYVREERRRHGQPITGTRSASASRVSASPTCEARRRREHPGPRQGPRLFSDVMIRATAGSRSSARSHGRPGSSSSSTTLPDGASIDEAARAARIYPRSARDHAKKLKAFRPASSTMARRRPGDGRRAEELAPLGGRDPRGDVHSTLSSCGAVNRWSWALLIVASCQLFTDDVVRCSTNA